MKQDTFLMGSTGKRIGNYVILRVKYTAYNRIVCRRHRCTDFLKSQVVKGVAIPWSLFRVGLMIIFPIVMMIRLLVMGTVSCFRVPKYSLMMMMRHQVVTQEG